MKTSVGAITLSMVRRLSGPALDQPAADAAFDILPSWTPTGGCPPGYAPLPIPFDARRKNFTERH